MLMLLMLMLMLMFMLMLMLTVLEMGFSVRSFSLPATTHCLGLSLTHNGGKELWLGDGIKDNRFVPTPVFSPSRVLLPPTRISMGLDAKFLAGQLKIGTLCLFHCWKIALFLVALLAFNLTRTILPFYSSSIKQCYKAKQHCLLCLVLLLCLS